MIMSEPQWDMWSYRQDSGVDVELDLTGYKVDASDGDIGRVDRASNDVEGSFIVVDTGPWIFGKKVILPAGVITRVDPGQQKVFVSISKDEIKAAPEFDENRAEDKAYSGKYRNQLGGYYGNISRGKRGNLP